MYRITVVKEDGDTVSMFERLFDRAAKHFYEATRDADTAFALMVMKDDQTNRWQAIRRYSA